MRVLTMAILVTVMSLVYQPVSAQCSVCTKTAQQLGHKPAKGLNTGIIYLMFAPFMIIGAVGYRWWKNNKG